jgi:CRISPR-associated protein Cas5t
MEATFTLELVAEQPGDFVGEVIVKSEVNVLTLTVSAKVLAASQPDADGAAAAAAAAAVAIDEDEDEGGVVAAGGDGAVASSKPGSAGMSTGSQ